jgi:protoheme IX farnesyltransferase
VSSTTIDTLKKESKFKSYLVFTKFRLSALVVISALSGYLFVIFRDGASVNWQVIFNLMVGGSLVTAASNGANQIWERELDIMMRRTQTRPLPQRRMSLKEAYLIVILCLVLGSWLLYRINFLSAFLGVCAFISYVFIYTPMKRVSPWAVFVGAFPGAIPPMLGAIAYTNKFGLEPGILFFVQFVWQFPHFWAIAWVVFDDYKAGGFSLLPSKFGKSKNSAYQIMVYSLFLIPFTLLPWVLGWTGSITLVVATILGGWFFWYSYRLFITCDDKDAKKLMFASFFYLPLVQFLYVLDYVPIKK